MKNKWKRIIEFIDFKSPPNFLSRSGVLVKIFGKITNFSIDNGMAWTMLLLDSWTIAICLSDVMERLLRNNCHCCLVYQDDSHPLNDVPFHHQAQEFFHKFLKVLVVHYFAFVSHITKKNMHLFPLISIHDKCWECNNVISVYVPNKNLNVIKIALKDG